MKLSDFSYDLPKERIAQTPLEPRDSSRLMVLDRSSGDISHKKFFQIADLLNPGDLLVVNQTRVIPARLYGKKKETGGKVELLLLSRKKAQTWEALVGGRRMTVGKKILLENGMEAEVIEELSGARRLVLFNMPLSDSLNQIGNVPLPPYITTPLERPERYQTVYAKDPGSAAAPTAGLHFTPELLDQIKEKGVGFVSVTLHVGLDTFAPVTEEDVSEHQIHTEWCKLSEETAKQIKRTHEQGGRVIAVGTTSVRVVESAARYSESSGEVNAYEGPTDLFILPGYQYQVVDAIITNFHLPESTLLMMISAFAGRESVLTAYQKAIDHEYRFYSFGDAMFIK